MATTTILDDLGIADNFTVRAGVAISGGMWARATSGSWSASVAATGTTAVYDYSAVTVTNVDASGTNTPLGLALKDTASGTSTEFAIIRKGTVILRANGAVTAGGLVAASNAGAATALIANIAADEIGARSPVGRAYTACGSNEFAVVQLTL